MKVKLVLFCFYKRNLRLSAFPNYAKNIYLNIQPNGLRIFVYNASFLKVYVKRTSMRVYCLNNSPFVLFFKIFLEPRAHRLIQFHFKSNVSAHILNS